MNRQELYDYLNKVDVSKYMLTPMSSVYFMVKHDGIEEPFYFFAYEESYFESDCILYKYQCDYKQLIEYIKETYEEDSQDEALEYELTMWENGILYSIESYEQCPFLNKVEYIYPISEQDCLTWLIEHDH